MSGKTKQEGIYTSEGEDVREVKSEHVDYVLLRMKHLLLTTPSNMAELRPLVFNELNSSSIYRAAWNEATKIFEDRKSELVSLNHPVPDEYHIALIVYTIHDIPADNPFVKEFNKLTRELCSGLQIEESYPFKAFFKLLTLAINALNKNPLFQSPSPSYYRGAGIGFTLKCGQHIAFQHFVSTTTNLKIAEEFSSNSTVFEFRGPIPNSIALFHHSKFPHEEELLVQPTLVYHVESIHREKYYTRVGLSVSTIVSNLDNQYRV